MGTSFPASFSAKMFLLGCSINWPNSIAWLPLIREILSNMCVVILKKVKTKMYKYWQRKELLRLNKKHFSSFLKAIIEANNKSFLECQSPNLKTDGYKYKLCNLDNNDIKNDDNRDHSFPLIRTLTLLQSLPVPNCRAVLIAKVAWWNLSNPYKNQTIKLNGRWNLSKYGS